MVRTDPYQNLDIFGSQRPEYERQSEGRMVSAIVNLLHIFVVELILIIRGIVRIIGTRR